MGKGQGVSANRSSKNHTPTNPGESKRSGVFAFSATVLSSFLRERPRERACFPSSIKQSRSRVWWRKKSRAHTRTSTTGPIRELVGSVQKPINQREQSFLSQTERGERERERERCGRWDPQFRGYQRYPVELEQ